MRNTSSAGMPDRPPCPGRVLAAALCRPLAGHYGCSGACRRSLLLAGQAHADLQPRGDLPLTRRSLRRSGAVQEDGEETRRFDT